MAYLIFGNLKLLNNLAKLNTLKTKNNEQFLLDKNESKKVWQF